MTSPFTRPDGWNPDPWIILYGLAIAAVLALACWGFWVWRKRR